MACKHLAEPDEGSHYPDVDLDGPFALQDSADSIATLCSVNHGWMSESHPVAKIGKITSCDLQLLRSS